MKGLKVGDSVSWMNGTVNLEGTVTGFYSRAAAVTDAVGNSWCVPYDILNKIESERLNFWGELCPVVRNNNKCECGSQIVGSSAHSDYCPLHEKDPV